MHEFVEAVHNRPTDGRDAPYVLLLARLESHGGAGRDVELWAECGRTLEGQRAVHFVEAEVGSHLNRSIARVLDMRLGNRSAGVEEQRALRGVAGVGRSRDDGRACRRTSLALLTHRLVSASRSVEQHNAL
jgi:hypothetical protein